MVGKVSELQQRLSSLPTPSIGHAPLSPPLGRSLLGLSKVALFSPRGSVPLRGDGDGSYRGQKVSELIDGVLADSGGYETYGQPNISVARLEALEDAKFRMIA